MACEALLLMTQNIIRRGAFPMYTFSASSERYLSLQKRLMDIQPDFPGKLLLLQTGGESRRDFVTRADESVIRSIIAQATSRCSRRESRTCKD